jgi:hypothetical protein
MRSGQKTLLLCTRVIRDGLIGEDQHHTERIIAIDHEGTADGFEADIVRT